MNANFIAQAEDCARRDFLAQILIAAREGAILLSDDQPIPHDPSAAEKLTAMLIARQHDPTLRDEIMALVRVANQANPEERTQHD